MERLLDPRRLDKLSDVGLLTLAHNVDRPEHERDDAIAELERRKAARPLRAVLVGIEMPFGALVKHLVVLGLAAIPAMIILSIVGFVVVAVLAAFTGGSRP